MISVLSEPCNVHAIGIVLHDTIYFKNILATIDFCHKDLLENVEMN